MEAKRKQRRQATENSPRVYVSLLGLALIALVAAPAARAIESPPPETTTPGDPAALTSPDWRAHYHSAGNKPGARAGLLEGPSGGIWQRSQLLGDPGGVRSALGRLGISIALVETSEVLGNLTGGAHQGFKYDGLATLDLQVDSHRAFGWRGGTFNVSALELHGRNLSAENLLSLQTASGIQGDQALRLWELWYQQSFWYRQIDFRLGLQSLDQEFMVSQYAGLFVNTMFGWPMVPSADLLSGGPAYPLASLGLRVKAQPEGTPWTILAGVFDDNPSGVSPISKADPQQLNAHGTSFRLGDGPLGILEVQYSRPAIGEMEYPGEAGILPGTYKLGFWYDFGHFADQQLGTDGLSLASPSSNGTAQLRAGNYSLYAVADQLVWRASPESSEGVGVFFRGMVAPADQNLISVSVNAGVTWRAPIPHREYDVLGLGMGWANVSGRAAALDRDTALVQPGYPVRTSETFVELTYQYQLVPWMQLQPDLQYVFNPGGGIPNPQAANANETVGNELVVGMRTNISF